MIQINGVAAWNTGIEDFLTARDRAQVDAANAEVDKLVGGPEAWMRLTEEFAVHGGQADYDTFVDGYKNKAGVGPLLQRMSVRDCADFARAFGYLFYAGQDGKMTRS